MRSLLESQTFLTAEFSITADLPLDRGSSTVCARAQGFWVPTKSLSIRNSFFSLYS
jgi:hypothetical protein